VEEGFLVVTPFDPNTIRIRITRDGRALTTVHSGRTRKDLRVSLHAPQLTLLQPRGGDVIGDHLDIHWEATDLDRRDARTLFYTVQYSPDSGASWQTLVTNMPETNLIVDDTSSLPGSDQALIRVIAHDGVNTGSDTSGPFTLRPHEPIVHIDSPNDETTFPLNSQIILEGGARDAEDGPLGDDALTWLVDGQQLGTGEEAAVGGLPVGTYVFTLQAVDSDRNVATADVTVTVVQDVPVASADSYSTFQDTPINVDSPGVLGNDIGPEGSTLSVELVDDVSNGLLTLSRDGSFNYTPDPNFNGTDKFTYRAIAGNGFSNVATVSLTAGIFSDEAPKIPPGDELEP
jgi:Bacterial Ig domain